MDAQSMAYQENVKQEESEYKVEVNDIEINVEERHETRREEESVNKKSQPENN